MRTPARILLPLLLLTAFTATASDLAKEKRWADQVIEVIFDGEPEWLNDGTSDFLTIYTEAADDSKRGLVIMHGTGIHPNWQQVILPLRVEMAGNGWHTLSIQMPILPNDADYKEYLPLYPEVIPRVDAAIGFLKDKGIEQIVLLGHSQGAAMGTYYLASDKAGESAAVDAFVGIGTFSSGNDDAQDAVEHMRDIKLPMLDLYGSEDLEEVLKYSADRARALHGEASAQVKVEGANHFFDGKESELVEAVDNWLQQL